MKLQGQETMETGSLGGSLVEMIDATSFVIITTLMWGRHHARPSGPTGNTEHYPQNSLEKLDQNVIKPLVNYQLIEDIRNGLTYLKTQSVKPRMGAILQEKRMVHFL